MELAVRSFFEHYARTFMQALAGHADMEAVAALYAPEFIAASPQGVMAGRNDAELRQALAQGYEQYRRIGTREMRLGTVRVVPIDALHCLAHVGWTAVYARPRQPDLEIVFEVHYLLQVRDGAPKVFGWISGDEQALRRQHGLLADRDRPHRAGNPRPRQGEASAGPRGGASSD